MKELLTFLIEKINATLQPIKRVLSFNASGKGMAIGKMSERDGLEVDWEAQFNKGVKVGGNLTGKYLTGTWLQTTAVTDLGSKPPKVAVLDNSGWIYYRTLEELRADLGINDYIVERGTSSIWTYRKWNSGISECWGRQDDLKITDGYAMFNSFPSGLFIDDRPEVVNANAWYGISNNRQPRKLHITAERGNFVYLRNYDGSLPTGTFAVMIEAKGRWK